jgi:hypothetical protein
MGEEAGIGFFLEGKEAGARFGHGGWDEGFVAVVVFYKEGGVGAVVMLNSNEGNPLLNEIGNSVAREYNWPKYFPPVPEPVKLAEEAADALVGEYETESKLRFIVTRQGENLLLAVGSQPPLALIPLSETSFLPGQLNGKVSFEKDAQGRGSKLTLEQEGRPTTAERRPPASAAGSS